MVFWTIFTSFVSQARYCKYLDLRLNRKLWFAHILALAGVDGMCKCAVSWKHFEQDNAWDIPRGYSQLFHIVICFGTDFWFKKQSTTTVLNDVHIKVGHHLSSASNTVVLLSYPTLFVEKLWPHWRVAFWRWKKWEFENAKCIHNVQSSSSKNIWPH